MWSQPEDREPWCLRETELRGTERKLDSQYVGMQLLIPAEVPPRGIGYIGIMETGGIMGGAGASGQRSKGAGNATATPAAHKPGVPLKASAIVFVAMTIAFLFSFGCLATALWIGATAAYFGAFMPTNSGSLSKLVQAGLLFTSFAITVSNWEACKPVAWIPVLLSYSSVVDAAKDKWKS